MSLCAKHETGRVALRRPCSGKPAVAETETPVRPYPHLDGGRIQVKKRGAATVSISSSQEWPVRVATLGGRRRRLLRGRGAKPERWWCGQLSQVHGSARNLDG